MFLALFRRVFRWLRPDGVRAPNEVSGYVQGICEEAFHAVKTHGGYFEVGAQFEAGVVYTGGPQLNGSIVETRNGWLWVEGKALPVYKPDRFIIGEPRC